MSKVKSKKTKYVVDAGVGIQWETDERGWGLKTTSPTAGTKRNLCSDWPSALRPARPGGRPLSTSA